MKIADRTPYRNAGGVIDFFGRVQGTLKYGTNWYARLQAQDVVIAGLDKILGANFVLLRNVTLPETDIDLPLVLIGPPGVFLINAIHERGVYRAKDDEWGTVIGSRFVPAAINQLQRTVKLGRVLQVYLNRSGFKDVVVVDPILMAASPGLHIDSTRPAARIVMSDALERFAVSINQAHSMLTAGLILSIAQTIVNGPGSKETEKAPGETISAPTGAGYDTAATLVNAAPASQDTTSGLSADAMGFSFNEGVSGESGSFSSPEGQPGFDYGSGLASGSLPSQDGGFSDQNLRNAVFLDDSDTDSALQPLESPVVSQAEQNSGTRGTANRKPSHPGKKTLFGMTAVQFIILGAILLFWICSMAAFAGYIFFLS